MCWTNRRLLQLFGASPSGDWPTIQPLCQHPQWKHWAFIIHNYPQNDMGYIITQHHFYKWHIFILTSYFCRISHPSVCELLVGVDVFIRLLSGTACRYDSWVVSTTSCSGFNQMSRKPCWKRLGYEKRILFLTAPWLFHCSYIGFHLAGVLKDTPFYQGLLFSHGLTGIMVAISNHIHDFMWDIIAHPCPKFNSDLTNPPTLKLGHGWVITSHCSTLM